jgi:hypothetical protein
LRILLAIHPKPHFERYRSPRLHRGYARNSACVRQSRHVTRALANNSSPESWHYPYRITSHNAFATIRIVPSRATLADGRQALAAALPHQPAPVRFHSSWPAFIGRSEALAAFRHCGGIAWAGPDCLGLWTTRGGARGYRIRQPRVAPPPTRPRPQCSPTHREGSRRIPRRSAPWSNHRRAHRHPPRE